MGGGASLERVGEGGRGWERVGTLARNLARSSSVGVVGEIANEGKWVLEVEWEREVEEVDRSL